jgi:hypothetical protein
MLLVAVFCSVRSVIHLWCSVCLVSAMGNNVVSTAAAPAKEAKIAEQKPMPVIANKSRQVNVHKVHMVKNLVL